MSEENKSALQYGYKLNEYRIYKFLGSGGFGITYLAYDTQTERFVVIKEYFPNGLVVRGENSSVGVNSSNSYAFYEKGLKRFEQEANILARYQEPNIVKVIDLFLANNTAYFVMEYYEGEDLLQQYKKRKSPYSEDEIINILLPLLEALRVIHKDNIYHRDIKPDNILIREDGTLVLIDFGAAKIIDEDDDIMKHSSMNAQTEAYSAPEQQLSISGMIGPYTDFYAIGVLLYKLMSGKLPTNAKNRSASITQSDPDPYVSISIKTKGRYSKNLTDVVDATLQMDRKKRPQSVDEFLKIILPNIGYEEDSTQDDTIIVDEKIVDKETVYEEDTTQDDTINESKTSYFTYLFWIILFIVIVISLL